MSAHVQTWFDSPDYRYRRQALQLWSDGSLSLAVRAEPGEVWGPPTHAGAAPTVAEAATLAAVLGLHHTAGPVEAAAARLPGSASDPESPPADESAAEELARLRRSLSELPRESPEHRATLDRLAVLVREHAVSRAAPRPFDRPTQPHEGS